MEDTFLDGIFLGMRLRSDELSLEQPEELSRRGNLDNLFLGSTATTFLQQFRTEQEFNRMLIWDNRMKVLIHRKHDKFRCHQTELLPKYVQIR